MPDDLRVRIDDLVAVHSAKVAYAPDGIYGDVDSESDRATRIVPSDAANAQQRHPLVRIHPETGRRGVYSCAGYICGIDGMDAGAARDLLVEIYRWQTADDVVYRHRWEPNMLVMWDNRAVLHRATGGVRRARAADAPHDDRLQPGGAIGFSSGRVEHRLLSRRATAAVRSGR